MVASVAPGVAGETGLRRLALAVLRQAVDDIRFRPYRERRHCCCPYPPDLCAHRFFEQPQAETWCDVAGLSVEAVVVRLTARMAPL